MERSTTDTLLRSAAIALVLAAPSCGAEDAAGVDDALSPGDACHDEADISGGDDAAATDAGADPPCEGSGCEPAPTDADQDGVTAAGGDCDDFNRHAFPGARERARDGIDANCDGDDNPQLGDNLYDTALGIMDVDADGTISFSEFEAACARSAQLSTDDARPGVVAVHASCSGTVQCRGMVLHPWRELFVHDCRGVNYCSSWSCVETAPDEGVEGAEAYTTAGCLDCHSGENGAFKVLVPPGNDVDAYTAAFFDRSDRRLAGAIAFGVRGFSPGGVAQLGMPSHYEQLSRREIDAIVAHLRTLPTEGKAIQWAEEIIPDAPEE